MLYKTLILLISVFITIKVPAQSIEKITFEELQPRLHKQNDTLYLVNFWATWCVPCVKELPAIEKLAQEYKNSAFKVLLISLDMPKQADSRLAPFIKNNNIKSEVVLLNDTDFNKWIDKVDPTWSGAIPASLIYRNNDRTFYEQSFTYEELLKIIQTKIDKL